MDNLPKKSFKLSWWQFLVLINIMLIILFFIIIYWRKEENNNNINQNGKKSSEQNINISTVEEEKINTSDWLTYRNETAKFELKYPPKNWEIEVVKDQDPNTTLTPTFRYCGYQEGSSYLGFYVYDYQVEADATLESQFLVLDLDRIIEQKYITLDHEKALYTIFLRQNRSAPEEFIDVLHNLRPYRLFLGQEPEEKCQNDLERTATYRVIQDEILSTFKFID